MFIHMYNVYSSSGTVYLKKKTLKTLYKWLNIKTMQKVKWISVKPH